MISFDELRIGDSVEVVGYAEENPQVLKLQSLGLVPGTRFTVIRVAPLGDPVQVRVRGFTLAMSQKVGELLQLIPR